MVRFKGVNDRNAAEALTGTELFVDRSTLPDDGDEDEFYHADLVGLAVRDETRRGDRQGRPPCRISARGDILEITLAGPQGRADPVHPGRRAGCVDLAGGSSASTPSRPGLLDDEDGDGAAGSPTASAASSQAPPARAEGRRRQPVSVSRHAC